MKNLKILMCLITVAVALTASLLIFLPEAPAAVSAVTPPVVSTSLLDSSYDVIVAGAGTGGVSAAIQAARMGVKVLLIEETDWIGGQMTTAAVTSMDEGGVYVGKLTQVDKWVGVPERGAGLYKEFREGILGVYAGMQYIDSDSQQKTGLSTETCYWNRGTMAFEADIGQDVLYAMIKKTPGNLHISMRTTVTNVEMSGNKVSKVTLKTPSGDRIIQCKVLIDATECGDVIPLTPARYRASNLIYKQRALTPNQPNSNEPLLATIQDITWTAVIKKYPSGVPAGLKMNAAPFADSTPDVALYKTYANAKKEFGVTNWDDHTAYRGMPNRSGPNATANPSTSPHPNRTDLTKTGVNWFNDYSINGAAPRPLVKEGPCPNPADPTTFYNPEENKCYDYSEAFPPLTVRYLEDKDYRKKINDAAKIRTLQFLYYAQSADGLNQSQWSISTDEKFNTPFNLEQTASSAVPAAFKDIESYFPLRPYVRESRRIVGLHTLRYDEAERTSTVPWPEGNIVSADVSKFPQPHSIAIGYYDLDLHKGNAITGFEGDLGETYLKKVPGWITGPFQIPFEVFIPETVDGLLVAEKNLSVSRWVNGGIRLQPVTMMTGQAAGAIAALAVQKNIQPRNLKPVLVQNALVNPSWGIAPVPVSIYKFSDVPGTPVTDTDPSASPYWPYVQIVSTYGYMGGVGNAVFDIAGNLTRGQAAIVFVRFFDLPLVAYSGAFPDVSSTHYAANYIQTLYNAGLISGYPDGTFKPDDPLTRAGFATIIVRGLGLEIPADLGPQIFTDVPSTEWFYKFVQVAAQNGIVTGCDAGNFCPNVAINRGDTTKYLVNALISATLSLNVGSHNVKNGQLLKFEVVIGGGDSDKLAYTVDNLPCKAQFVTVTEKMPGLYGDVNFDAKVDVADATLVSNFVGKTATLTEAQKIVADVNANGRVDKGDAELIGKYPTAKTFPAIIRYGDVTLDGAIDRNDLKLLTRFLAGKATLTEIQKIAADVNSDANLDVSDVALLQQYADGKITSFSVATKRWFAWTPDQSGTFGNVSFKVTDGKITAKENITITVTP